MEGMHIFGWQVYEFAFAMMFAPIIAIVTYLKHRDEAEAEAYYLAHLALWAIAIPCAMVLSIFMCQLLYYFLLLCGIS